MEINAIALAANVYTPDTVLGISEALKVSITGVCVVMFELALIACFILLMAKIFKLANKNKKEEVKKPVEAPKPAGTPLAEGNSAGKLDLIDVDEPTAAVIMAIISDQSGIPLNRLNFKSIKKLEDK